MEDEEPLNSPEQVGKRTRRSRSEWISIGVLAVFTLAVIYAWGAAAGWIISMILGLIR